MGKFSKKMIDSKKVENVQEENLIYLDGLNYLALQVSTSDGTLSSFNEEMVASRWPN